MGDGDNKTIGATEQKEQFAKTKESLRAGALKAQAILDQSKKNSTQVNEPAQKPESLLKKFTNLFKRDNKKYPVKDIEWLPDSTNSAKPQSKTEVNTNSFVKEYDFEKTFPQAQHTPLLDSKGFVVEIDHSAKAQKENSASTNKPKVDDLVITDIKFLKRKESSPDNNENDKHRRKHSHSHSPQKPAKADTTPALESPKTRPTERKGLERGPALQALLRKRSQNNTEKGGNSR